MSALPERPLTVLISVMGGQGGGGVEPMASRGGRLLSNWIVAAARAQGLPVQSTLTPGTSQRTGITAHYIEIYPAPQKELGGRRPIFRLAPRTGDVDLVISFELAEAVRAVQAGHVSARTTLVASSHRFLTLAEKTAMTDGRQDSQALLATAYEAAGRAILFDMGAPAQTTEGSISAVALGAVAALDLLPLPAAAFEDAIRALGPDADANLAAFAAGQAGAASADVPPAAVEDEDLKRPNAAKTPLALLERMQASLSADTWPIVREGLARLVDYQGAAYAARYLDRLDAIAAIDSRDAGPAIDHELTRETARYLALWMSYEDVIRVADLKTRAARWRRVREEVGAAPGEPMAITEFLKPGIDEWTSVLPRFAARPLRRAAVRLGLEHRLNLGMHIKTSALWGFLLLWSLARLRFLRPLSLGFAEENALIERWLAAIRRAAEADRPLALEIVECARMIKGYSGTRRRGVGNLLRVFEALVEPALEGGAPADAVRNIARARQAALSDPEGEGLESALAQAAE